MSRSYFSPFNNRANRDYFDHIYEPENSKRPSSIDENSFLQVGGDKRQYTSSWASSENSRVPRRMTGREKRLRRKKLMLMSTWVEDLLPDPYQGQDPVLNYLMNTVKFTTRGLINLLYALHSLKGVHFPKPRYLIS